MRTYRSWCSRFWISSNLKRAGGISMGLWVGGVMRSSFWREAVQMDRF